MPTNLTMQLTPEDDAIARRVTEAFDDDWAGNYISAHKFRCRDDVRWIEANMPSAKVLNIGGAPYLFEAFAKDAGLDVTSLDLDLSRHRSAIEALGVVAECVDIENPDQRETLPLAEFDIICLCEVFEHMRHDLVGLLRFLHSGMRDDAVLYLTTPNFFYAPALFRNLVERRSGPSLVQEWSKIGDLGHMGHVREYSRRELLELFNYAGFSQVEVTVRNSSAFTFDKTVKNIVPLGLASILCRNFDGFGKEFVFTIRK